MTDLYGTGGPIAIGSQVVVESGEVFPGETLMGTVETIGCPVFGNEAGPAYHVRIEGDREATCYPARLVKLYADVYAGTVE